MLRALHALVFALAAVVVTASGAHALGSESALTKISAHGFERVGSLALEALGTRQQSASHGKAIASGSTHAARGGASALRATYVSTAEELGAVAGRLRAGGMSAEEVVRTISPLRNELNPGTFAICPVCFWEDDDVQFRDPQFKGGANTVSLEAARTNFRAFGAIEEQYRGKVRPPLPAERPS